MLFAGFSVSEGEMTLFGIVAAGVLGNLVGSWIAYAVGYFGRIDLLEKNKLIHISPKHLKWADDWFARYGAATVFFSRMLPIIRTFISLPAGVARMPFWRFTAYTLLGSIPWVLMLALVGEAVGDNWEDWRHKLGYLDYVVLAAIVVGVIYLVRKRRRGGSETAGTSEA
jgi:membrane protein DedA with SNARE-associated domain